MKQSIFAWLIDIPFHLNIVSRNFFSVRGEFVFGFGALRELMLRGISRKFKKYCGLA